MQRLMIPPPRKAFWVHVFAWDQQSIQEMIEPKKRLFLKAMSGELINWVK